MWLSQAQPFYAGDGQFRMILGTTLKWKGKDRIIT